MTRECPGPDPASRLATSFKVPAGAVDTHAHIIGPSPYAETRSYTAPPALPAAYLNMLDAIGVAYAVLVQASVHSIDNSLLLETLSAHPGRLRGIAVAPPRPTRARLAADAQGRGLFRKDCEGTTLCEHLGLPWPPNRFFAA